MRTKTNLEALTDFELKEKIDDAHSILKENLEKKGGAENPNNIPIAAVINIFSAELNSRSSKRFAFWSIVLVITSIAIQILDFFCS